MKYISLFSGIEAASVAWSSLGWEPIAFSEIEPYSCELLAQRYPDVPNLGDITEIDWSLYRGKCNLIVGGSPCQSFSIAGTRTGLAGESGLMFEYIRAIREVMPRYFVWENVPGALSSEKGGAFGQLLYEMDVLGYGVSWRVLDAQFFGVPQRRRRLFLVGCLGDPERAFEILFERESVCWDYPSSREKRKNFAASTPSSAESSNKSVIPINTMVATRGNKLGRGTGFGVGAPDEAGYIITATHPHAVCYALQGNMIGRTDRNGPQGAGVNEELSFTLNTTDRHAVVYLPFNPTQVTSPANGNNPKWGDPCHTLAATDRPPHVVCMADANAKAAIDENLCDTLKVGEEPPISVYEGQSKFVVRKLMPIECERLQGFPDGWTDIVFKGKPASDAARYKALGNSMAVPCMLWIGKRIAHVAKDGE